MFGRAPVVYNDALRARAAVRVHGDAFWKTGDLSKLLITEAKPTEERAWLGEVSAVVRNCQGVWMRSGCLLAGEGT